MKKLKIVTFVILILALVSISQSHEQSQDPEFLKCISKYAVCGCSENLKELNNQINVLDLRLQNMNVIMYPKLEEEIVKLHNNYLRTAEENINLHNSLNEIMNKHKEALEKIKNLEENGKKSEVQITTEKPQSEENKTECKPSIGGLKMTNIVNKCYYIEKVITLTWNEAQDFCIRNQLQLLSIETELENTALANYFIASLPATDNWWFWTSGRFDGEGPWTWNSTNTQFNFTAFASLRPQKHLNRVYTIKNLQNFKLEWDNWEGNWKARFICELP